MEVRGIFKHFAGFGLCLLSKRIPARPHAGKAHGCVVEIEYHYLFETDLLSKR